MNALCKPSLFQTNNRCHFNTTQEIVSLNFPPTNIWNSNYWSFIQWIGSYKRSQLVHVLHRPSSLSFLFKPLLFTFNLSLSFFRVLLPMALASASSLTPRKCLLYKEVLAVHFFSLSSLTVRGGKEFVHYLSATFALPWPTNIASQYCYSSRAAVFKGWVIKGS